MHVCHTVGPHCRTLHYKTMKLTNSSCLTLIRYIKIRTDKTPRKLTDIIVHVWRRCAPCANDIIPTYLSVILLLLLSKVSRAIKHCCFNLHQSRLLVTKRFHFNVTLHIIFLRSFPVKSCRHIFLWARHSRWRLLFINLLDEETTCTKMPMFCHWESLHNGLEMDFFPGKIKSNGILVNGLCWLTVIYCCILISINCLFLM